MDEPLVFRPVFSGVPVASLPVNATLVANTAQTITWDGPSTNTVRVVNTTSGTVAWVRAGVVATVAGTECWPVVGGEEMEVPCAVNAGANTASISVISAGTPVVSVIPAEC